MKAKFILTLTISLFAQSYLHAQGNTWKSITNFGGGARGRCAGFEIEGKGYIGTGIDNSQQTQFKNDLWQYDPVTNSWTQKANFPGTARYGAVGFNINGKGYIGTGNDNRGSTNDFYEYDPTTNSWNQKASYPGGVRIYSVGFSINGKGYVGTGTNFSGPTSDFWEFDPLADSWVAKAGLSGGARYGAVAFSINGRGYVGTGRDNSTNGVKKDFYEYNPVTNTWTSKPSFGGFARFYATGFSIKGKGYIGTGNVSTGGFLNDFWEFDPVKNEWIQKTGYEGTARDGAVGISIGSKGYIGTGADNNGYASSFYEYSPSIEENNWTGKINNNWNEPGNWSLNIVPESNIDIVIDSSAVKPALFSNTVVKNITLNDELNLNGQTLTIDGVVSGTGTFVGSTTSNLIINGNAGKIMFSPAAALLFSLKINTGGSATIGSNLIISGH